MSSKQFPFFLQLSAPQIYNPNALPLYREDLPGRALPKKRRKEVEDEKHKYTPSGGSMAKGNCSACLGVPLPGKLVRLGAAYACIYRGQLNAMLI